MREILFRGKSVDKNEFIYGLPYSSCYDEEIDQIVVHDYHVDIRPETIGQFTGLKDKNGKKIFENDIVRWDDETNGEKWRVAVVEFNPDIQFRIIRIECDFIQSAKEGYVFKFGRFAYKDTHNHLEIIGNIHE